MYQLHSQKIVYLMPVSIEACSPCQNYSKCIELKQNLLILAVVNNVFDKSDLWQDINEAILLFISAKNGTFVSIQNSTCNTFAHSLLQWVVSVHQPPAM